MQPPATPATEDERLGALLDLDILDTLPEEVYDDLVRVASAVTGCPISLVSLVAGDRQWFKARTGLEATETPRAVSFCAHAINDPDELFVVEDAASDPRFADNPLVTDDPSIRFYAGMPLTLSSGATLGTLCVIDRRPRVLDDDEREALAALTRIAVSHLELRRVLLDTEHDLQDMIEYERVLSAHRDELERDLVIERMASHRDELTGVLNRRGLLRHGGALFDVRHRTGRPLSAMMLDIDHFKTFNDDFGHAAGDRALRRVAAAIQHVTRPVDLVARHGGEEFTVLTPTDLDHAVVLAERIRRAVSEESIEGRPVTISIGVASLSTDIDRLEDLVEAADTVLYGAKEAGRDRVVSA